MTPVGIEFPTLVRLLAVLRNVEYFKDSCRGRYDNKDKGRIYCRCANNEICQIRLAEVSKFDESSLTHISLNLETLEKFNVVSIRYDNTAPRNKPRKYYSLPDDWEANFIAMLKQLSDREFEKLKERA